MRATLNFISTEVDTPERQLLGLSDMEIITIDGRTFLLAAGAADGGMSSFEILENGVLVAIDDVLQSPTSGTVGVADLNVFSLNGVVYVLPAGKFDDNQMMYTLGSDGTFSASQSYSDGASTYENWGISEVVEINGITQLFGAAWAKSGYFQFDIGASAALSNPTWHADTTALYLGDVTAIHSATLRGNTFMFIASGVDSGLHSFRFASDGGYTLIDTAPPEEGGFSGITSLAAIDNGERSFLVVGDAGSDSLLVFRVSSGGKIKLIDTLVDTGETRFAGVQALEVFEANGRVFVLAGGADDGITLLEITYKGELRVLTSVADTALMALQNITDIETVLIGGELHVFASSATDHGFTQFVMVIPNGANILRGGTGADTLTGGAGDDTIFGHGYDDTLSGMGGNDRLIDGRGEDRMWGGTGADIFEFVRDKADDYIMDFEIGVDKIDLSDYPLLFHYSDITFTATANGVTLQIGEDTLYITSMDSNSLSASMFVQDDFIFG